MPIGAAIKAARIERKESRKQVCDKMYIGSRYLANIENKGQHPSLQVFIDLVTRYHISVDQFLYDAVSEGRSTARRQLDAILDTLDEKDIQEFAAALQAVISVRSNKE